jgi:hypothetical protein
MDASVIPKNHEQVSQHLRGISLLPTGSIPWSAYLLGQIQAEAARAAEARKSRAKETVSQALARVTMENTDRASVPTAHEALQNLTKTVCRDAGELYRWCGRATALLRRQVEERHKGDWDALDPLAQRLTREARDRAISIDADASALQLFGGMLPASCSVMSAATGLTLLQSLADWSARKDVSGLLAAAKQQAEQKEERRQAAIEYRNWLRRLATLTNEFLASLPRYHQSELPADLVGTDGYERVADAFLHYSDSLKRENCRGENAYERLRRGWEAAAPRVRTLYALADAGDRNSLVELIRGLASLPQQDQFEMYRDVKWATDKVVNQGDLLECNWAIQELGGDPNEQPPTQPAPSPVLDQPGEEANAPLVACGPEGAPSGEPPDSQEDLTEKEAELLRAYLQLDATSKRKKVARNRAARKADPSSPPSTYNKANSALAKRRLLQVGTRREQGGCWLTAEGIELAKGLARRGKND